MRLTQLRIKNIASLRGEHLIDFRAILEQGPLFAITGETGSGKSSILNCISLALYGQVYKKNVNQTDVVTLGEKEGQIELIFEVNGKSYLADWRAKIRKQGGELLKQPLINRYVYPIDKAEFDANKHSPIDSISDLLRMDFDQFCKCVVLNQGEFARFLSSSFTERKEILEKLYPGEILDSLSKELKAELDLLSKDRNEIEIELSTFKGDLVDGQGLKAQIGDLKLELELHSGWLKKIETLDYHFISLFSYHTKFLENKKKSEHFKEELAQATSRFNQGLKELESATLTYHKAKRKMEERLPRLQTLLKNEEHLRHLEEARKTLVLKLEEVTGPLKLQQEALLRNETGIKTWTKELDGLLGMLNFPLELLKAGRTNLERLFEFHTEVEMANLVLDSKNEALVHLGHQGKEDSHQLLQIEEALKVIPSDLNNQLKQLDFERKRLEETYHKMREAQIQCQELKKYLVSLQKETEALKDKEKTLTAEVSGLKVQSLGLETSLKLHELMEAKTVCLTHAHDQTLKHCPVCEGPVPAAGWSQLLGLIKKSEIETIKKEFKKISHELTKKEEETRLILLERQSKESLIGHKKNELIPLQEMLELQPMDLKEFDDKINSLKLQNLEKERLKKDETRLKSILEKSREAYGKLRDEIQAKGNELIGKDKALSDLLANLQDLIKVDQIKAQIPILKLDLAHLNQLQVKEAAGDKLKQERSFLLSNAQKLQEEVLVLNKEVALKNGQISEQETLLQHELGGKRAQDLIAQLIFETKAPEERWARQEKELKSHELALKEHQSRLYNLDDLIKDLDLHFIKEAHIIREEAQVPLPTISEELTGFIKKLQHLDLDFKGPGEMFIPIKDLLSHHKELLKEKHLVLINAYAMSSARLESWEKRQDKILLLELKKSDLQVKIDRLERLFEVLGKDELRSFVLSLVEENLIQQTNEELRKLCQGRYEIIHQSRGMRMSPEFYILDKFKEGGRRKVSTLSGGETFMVSLAMALALAEMTRGQAQIDSLFIDEGFGTLDQESLEDVLDVLHQIRNRGLLVGIISHIKTLTNALPVNLALSKRSDGTSSISLQYN